MVKTSDGCHVAMFCLVYFISRHGLLKAITNFFFELETTNNSGQPIQFLGIGKDYTYILGLLHCADAHSIQSCIVLK